MGAATTKQSEINTDDTKVWIGPNDEKHQLLPGAASHSGYETPVTTKNKGSNIPHELTRRDSSLGFGGENVVTPRGSFNRDTFANAERALVGEKKD